MSLMSWSQYFKTQKHLAVHSRASVKVIWLMRGTHWRGAGSLPWISEANGQESPVPLAFRVRRSALGREESKEWIAGRRDYFSECGGTPHSLPPLPNQLSGLSGSTSPGLSCSGQPGFSVCWGTLLLLRGICNRKAGEPLRKRGKKESALDTAPSGAEVKWTSVNTSLLV